MYTDKIGSNAFENVVITSTNYPEILRRDNDDNIIINAYAFKNFKTNSTQNAVEIGSPTKIYLDAFADSDPNFRLVVHDYVTDREYYPWGLNPSQIVNQF